MFSVTEYYIYNSADESRSYAILKAQYRFPNDSTNYQSNWCKPIYSINEYIWCHVSEEAVKKCFAKSRILPKD